MVEGSLFGFSHLIFVREHDGSPVVLHASSVMSLGSHEFVRSVVRMAVGQPEVRAHLISRLVLRVVVNVVALDIGFQPRSDVHRRHCVRMFPIWLPAGGIYSLSLSRLRIHGESVVGKPCRVCLSASAARTPVGAVVLRHVRAVVVGVVETGTSQLIVLCLEGGLHPVHVVGDEVFHHGVGGCEVAVVVAVSPSFVQALSSHL